MKRISLAVVLLALVGCSTAPLANFLDFFAPGRIPEGERNPFGGVCKPQGQVVGPPIIPPAPGAIPGPAAPGPLIPAPIPADGGSPSPAPVIPPPQPPNGVNPLDFPTGTVRP